jgi:hypothetical protein
VVVITKVASSSMGKLIGAAGAGHTTMGDLKAAGLRALRFDLLYIDIACGACLSGAIQLLRNHF